MDKYLARLHGYVSGDGSTGIHSYPYKKNKPHLNIKIDDQACLNKILEAFVAIGYNSGVLEKHGNWGNDLRYRLRKEK